MLDIMYPATATALVGAGLITVMVFPALAFGLLGETAGAPGGRAGGAVIRHTARGGNCHALFRAESTRL